MERRYLRLVFGSRKTSAWWITLRRRRCKRKRRILSMVRVASVNVNRITQRDRQDRRERQTDERDRQMGETDRWERQTDG